MTGLELITALTELGQEALAAEVRLEVPTGEVGNAEHVWFEPGPAFGDDIWIGPKVPS